MIHTEEFYPDNNSPIDKFHTDVEQLISRIETESKQLAESQIYTDKIWSQVHIENQKILHILKSDGTYLVSINGEVSNGGWQVVENSNTIILKKKNPNNSSDHKLYELEFLADDVFILKKHGNKIQSETQFIVLALEPSVKNLDWEEALDKIYEAHVTSNSNLYLIIIGILLILALMYYQFA